MEQVIGIDFDNTLIGYDDVFFEHASSLNLISPQTSRSKKEVRDQIRLLDDGEAIWQKVQGFVYGRGISKARLNEGAEKFLKACAQRRIKTYVISHKTLYSQFDEAQVNLQKAAMKWMVANRFFTADGLGLQKSQVFFETTRLQKIERLKSLRCTHFIDDLQEVFGEEAFPSGVHKILFATQSNGSIPEDVKVFNSWLGIYEYFFS